MMRATRLFVKSIVTHPDVWPHLAEDWDSPEDFVPKEADYFKHGQMGYIEFHRAGQHWCQIHIGMLRGAKGVPEFCQGALAEMRRAGIERFTVMVARDNRAAIILALRCGFVRQGVLEGVLMRNGKHTDMIILGSK